MKVQTFSDTATTMTFDAIASAFLVTSTKTDLKHVHYYFKTEQHLRTILF